MSSDGRKPSAAPNSETAVRSTSSGTNVVARARAIAGSTVGDRVGDRAQRPRSRRRTRSRSASVAAARPSNSRYQTSSSGRVSREVDRVVLAVVVEALEAAHVADGRLGDDDALEALRHLVGQGVGGLDHRDAHEVAHRDDADEPARRRRPGCGGSPCSARLANAARASTSGATVSGSAGHPLRHLGGRRVGARGREPDHVAFGEDADRPIVVRRRRRPNRPCRRACAARRRRRSPRAARSRPA